MVTGDQQYPALATAYLSDILNDSSQMLRLECTSLEETKAALRVEMAELKVGIEEMLHNMNYEPLFRRSRTVDQSIKKGSPDKSMSKSYTSLESKSFSDVIEMNFCVITNGTTLEFILNDEYLRANFAFMLTYCSNMVAYQVSPLQKAALVCLMKLNLLDFPKILAIGDGYNDIMMMQAADVSIELTEEDNPCLHAADLRVSKWSLIHRLIFVK
jgi:magnesium-transporting ATPase (P-type)